MRTFLFIFIPAQVFLLAAVAALAGVLAFVAALTAPMHSPGDECHTLRGHSDG